MSKSFGYFEFDVHVQSLFLSLLYFPPVSRRVLLQQCWSCYDADMLEHGSLTC